MQPTLSDPHNHVPEVSPDDLWGDAEKPDLLTSRPSTILPPRRPPPEDSNLEESGSPNEGLRIDPSLQRRPTVDSVEKLEVQEIDGTVIRLNPEAPTQPRMPKQEVKLQPAFKKITGADSAEWGNRKKLSIRWVLGISFGVASVIIASLMLLPLINQSNAVTHRPDQINLTVDTTDVIENVAPIEQLLNLKPEAGDLFRKYATTGRIDDLATIVRDPEETLPLIRERTWAVLVSKRWNPGEGAKWKVLQVSGKPFGLLSGTYPDFAEFNSYFVQTEGQLRIDWKATTGYGTATFDELAKGQGNPAEIRGTIVPTDYYTPTLPEDKYQCYQLFAPDQIKAIWCYIDRDSTIAEQLNTLIRNAAVLESTNSPGKVTLRLEHGTDGALPNQWLIKEVLHEEWIKP